MEAPSKFARLRQRDASVPMLRLKMSRRRSQSQKENRERAVNSRRQLDHVPEMDSTLEASMAVNMSTIKETGPSLAPSAKTVAATQRMEQLKRWKEDKLLQKEKEKREKERKGVFKVGLFHAKEDYFSLQLPAATFAARPRETQVTVPQTRVTRSSKPDQKPNKPVMGRVTRSRAALVQPQPTQATTRAKVVQPAVPSTARPKAVQQAATRGKVVPRAEPVAPAAVHKSSNLDKPAGGRTRGNAKPVAPSTGRGRNRAVVEKTVPAVSEVVEKTVPAVSEVVEKTLPAVVEKTLPVVSEVVEKTLPAVVEKTLPVVSEVVDKTPVVSEDMESNHRGEEEEEVEGEKVVAESDTLPPRNATGGPTSFAPKGFVFEAPVGLSTFKFEPLTPRSADEFLRPSPNFNFPPVPLFEAETSGPTSGPSPPKSPHRSPQALAGPQEPQHDVPYFRSQVTIETDGLTSLCQLWEVKVDDDAIPEEMRDRMRTAVGQGRLLMKERFGQFLGLVDDCELGRGEKLTTCTDLQGFWEMVYFQVEDVFRKFDALKEAEARCWVEEDKPPPRRRKLVKKIPPTAAAPKGPGTNAEAKSRLAAVKAAMKAKQQAAAAEKAAQAAGGTEDNPSIQVSEAPTVTQATDTVVFNGGFFKVESPAKQTGSLSRLSAAMPPQASSPCGRVTRQSIAMSHLSPLNQSSPDHRRRTPARHALALPHTPHAQSEHCTVTEAGSSPESASHPVRDGEEKPEIGSQPLSPRLSPTPCIPTSPTSQAPEPDLSFTVSPYPVVPSTPTVVRAQESIDDSPDSSVVGDAPGLDMERYLQPSERFSLSPRNTDAMETSLPVDVEMESPIARHGDERTQEDADMPPTDLAQVFPPQLPQAVFIEAQNADSDLLLFTPDLRNRIRQSVCPNDLMVFTPPN